MVLFTADDATIDQKCAIARDVLDRFAEVPVLFLRAISSPLYGTNTVQKTSPALKGYYHHPEKGYTK
jgi:hypothetical protein